MSIMFAADYPPVRTISFILTASLK